MLVVLEAAHRLTAAQSIILAVGPSRLSSLGRLHHPLRQQQICSWKVLHAAHALRDPNRDLIEFEVVWGPSIAFSKRSHQKSPAANGQNPPNHHPPQTRKLDGTVVPVCFLLQDAYASPG